MRQFFHRIAFFVGVEVIMMSGFAYWSTAITPVDAGRLESAAYPAVGAVIGAIVGFGLIYLVGLVLAPYRQRNEARALLEAIPKPTPLLNRAELMRAMSGVQQTSGALLNAQERLDNLDAKDSNTEHTADIASRDSAYTDYSNAINRLDTEGMVAGEPFENIVSDLVGYVTTQVWFKMVKPTVIGGNPEKFRILSALQVLGKIAGRVAGVKRHINELTGQALDKEDSQTE
jgi:hypothetical protein